MSGDVQLELWLHQYKYDALQKAMAQTDRTIEQEMQYRLTDLYCDMVPQEQRDAIDARIQDEELAFAAKLELQLRCDPHYHHSC